MDDCAVVILTGKVKGFTYKIYIYIMQRKKGWVLVEEAVTGER